LRSGGYSGGAFPAGLAEWNDKFRDTAAIYWKGAAPASAIATGCARRAKCSTIAAEALGEPSISSPPMTASVNPSTDLVPRPEVANEANGRTGRQSDTAHGIAGRGSDRRCASTRCASADPHLLATLLLSQGPPMRWRRRVRADATGNTTPIARTTHQLARLAHRGQGQGDHALRSRR